MINREITEETWRELETNPPDFGLFNAKSISVHANIFIAVNHNSERHVLLQIRSIDNAVFDNKSRGLHVEGKSLIIGDSEEQPFMLVACTDKEGNKAFNLVVTDILLSVEIGEDPVTAVTKVLSKWRKFWGGAFKQLLTEEQIKGLFGETWFLLTWLLPKNVQWVDYWKGPTGARHDFEKVGLAIEAKTTSSVRGHIHKINGIDQLDAPQDGKLLFYSLRVRREGTAVNTLPIIIKKIEEILDREQTLFDLFEQKLALAGYSPAHALEYSEYQYRVVDERLYSVEKDFPKLSSLSIRDGIPSGVETIQYDINLEVCRESFLGRYPHEIRGEFI